MIAAGSKVVSRSRSRAEPHQLLPLRGFAQWWKQRNGSQQFVFYSAHSLPFIVPAALQAGRHSDSPGIDRISIADGHAQPRSDAC